MTDHFLKRSDFFISSLKILIKYVPKEPFKNKRLFLTGGTGFMGTWLLYAFLILNSKGFNLHVTVLSRNPKQFLKNHKIFNNLSWLEFIKGDIKSFLFPIKTFDFLIHAAADTARTAHEDYKNMFFNILYGTEHVCSFIKKCKVKRTLFISSGAVYGSQPNDIDLQPDDSALACNPLKAINAYGEGKRVMELLGSILEKETGLEFITARCFSFCGPGLPLRGHYAFGNFINDAIFNEVITVKGDGFPVRSYLFGSDMAIWILNVLIKGKSGISYNVGSNEPISMKDLALKVQKLIAPQKEVNILKIMDNSGDPRNRYVPQTQRSSEIGCRIWTSLEQAIIKTADYSSKFEI